MSDEIIPKEAWAALSEPVEAPDPEAVEQLDRLAAAAGRARLAREEKEAADTAWDVAREALARAYAEDGRIVEPMPPQPDDDHAHYVLTVPLATTSTYSPPELTPDPIGGGPVRSRSGEGQRPGQASARDRRATLVMEAMARLGDDMGAVATELGMKKNAVAQIVKFARRREAAEAARAARS